MKKRVVSLLLALLALQAMAAPSLAAEDMDRGILYYEDVIGLQYEDAQFFSEGLAAVKKNGKWGYIDKDNNVVIPFAYDVANIFSEGYAVVGNFAQGEDWNGEPTTIIGLGFVDANGNYKPFRRSADSYGPGPDDGNHYMYAYSYDESYDYFFYGGWVCVDGLFDVSGNQFAIEATRVPTEGLIPCWTSFYGGPGGYYTDVSGNVVLDFRDRYTYYDTNWNQLYATNDAYGNEQYDWDNIRYQKYISNILPFNQGLAIVWECIWDGEAYEERYQWGLIDTSGNWVITPQFDNYYYISYNRYQLFADSGLASVSKDGLYGAIDKSGNVVVPYRYEELRSYFEGRAAFKTGGLYGYIDETGAVVIPAQYQVAGGYANGYAAVYDGTKAYLIDRKGNEIPGSDKLDPDNYFVELADGSMVTYTPGEYVVIEEGGKYGYGKISYLPALPDRSEMSGWAYEEVTAAIVEELVPVSLQNMYRNNITREEFSELVVEAVSVALDTDREALVREKTGKALSAWVAQYPFQDTANDDVIAAYALGIVAGYGDGTFGPYAQISRQEAAAMLTRAAKTLGATVGQPQSAKYDDAGQIGSWAVESVNYVNSIGVMQGTGDNKFSPVGTYTREQSFVTIYRLFLAVVAQA